MITIALPLLLWRLGIERVQTRQPPDPLLAARGALAKGPLAFGAHRNCRRRLACMVSWPSVRGLVRIRHQQLATSSPAGAARGQQLAA